MPVFDSQTESENIQPSIPVYELQVAFNSTKLEL